MAIGEAHGVEPRAGIGEVERAHLSPGLAAIGRFAGPDSFEGAVLAHVSDERTVAPLQDRRLDVAESDEGLTRAPGAAAVVGKGHQGEGVGVAVEGEHDPAALELRRLAARLPPEALSELVAQRSVDLREERLGPGPIRSRHRLQPRSGEFPGPVLEVVGLEPHHPLPVPGRGADAFIVARGAVIGQRRAPLVVEDDRPEQPQLLRGIEKEAGVAVGEAGVVGERERLAPSRRPLRQPSPEDDDVIGLPFSSTAVPGDEQLAIGAFDDPRGMVVAVVQRKDKLGSVPRRFVGRDGADARPDNERGEKGGDNDAQACCRHGGIRR